jgi:hypothetical protein
MSKEMQIIAVSRRDKGIVVITEEELDNYDVRLWDIKVIEKK